MDITSLFKLSSGLFVISAKNNNKINGCIINTVLQATAEIPRVIAIINKDNYTNSMIRESMAFCVSVLDESVTMDTIRRFGFSSGRDREKFDSTFPAKKNERGIPYLTEGACAIYSCDVVSVTDADTHDIFLAEVKDAFSASDTHPLTYEYYHKELKGRVPKNASTYVPPADEGYVCSVCGYVEKSLVLPAGFTCPVCKQPASVFSKVK